MKHTVTIIFEVDSEDYDDAEDNPKWAVALAVDMLLHDADFPCDVTVSSGGVTETVDLDDLFEGEAEPE